MVGFIISCVWLVLVGFFCAAPAIVRTWKDKELRPAALMIAVTYLGFYVLAAIVFFEI